MKFNGGAVLSVKALCHRLYGADGGCRAALLPKRASRHIDHRTEHSSWKQTLESGEVNRSGAGSLDRRGSVAAAVSYRRLRKTPAPSPGHNAYRLRAFPTFEGVCYHRTLFIARGLAVLLIWHIIDNFCGASANRMAGLHIPVAIEQMRGESVPCCRAYKERPEANPKEKWEVVSTNGWG